MIACYSQISVLSIMTQVGQLIGYLLSFNFPVTYNKRHSLQNEWSQSGIDRMSCSGMSSKHIWHDTTRSWGELSVEGWGDSSAGSLNVDVEMFLSSKNAHESVLVASTSLSHCRSHDKGESASTSSSTGCWWSIRKESIWEDGLDRCKSLNASALAIRWFRLAENMSCTKCSKEESRVLATALARVTDYADNWFG